MRTTPPPQSLFKEARAVALVTRTGFATQKGELVRSVLYLERTNFAFATWQRNFIVVLTVLALLGFAVTLKPLWEKEAHKGWFFMVIRLLDLLSIAVPP